MASLISQSNGDHDHHQPKEHQKPEKQSIISTLPRENGWLSSDEVPVYQYQGFWYWEPILRGVLASQDPSNVKVSPSDIIVCSNPKSGTTWLKALSFAVTTRTRYDLYSEDHPLLSTVPHVLIPSFEKKLDQNLPFYDPKLGILSTHMPYTSLPKALLDAGCKIVYICRNPKDAFVSLWHFAHKMRLNKDENEPIPLEQASDLFCQGISPYGPYLDHVCGYWKASLDRPDKVLFLKYEDVMQDTILHVKKLAEFMGCPFSDEEEKKGVLARVVQLCSFESLSNMEVNKSGITTSMLGFTSLQNDRFFRKGKVGDSKNYLTKEMEDKIDQVSAEKLSPLGLQL